MSTDRPDSGSGTGTGSPLPGADGPATPPPEPVRPEPAAWGPRHAAPQAGADSRAGADSWAAPEPSRAWHPVPAQHGQQAWPGQSAPAPGQGWPYPPPPAHWSASPPPPLSGLRPSTVPAVRPRSWLVALTVVSGIMLLALVTTVAVPLLAGRPTSGGVPRLPAGRSTAAPTATPSPSPSAAPEPEPTATMPTDPDVLLRRNPVYRLRVAANCPGQRIPSSQTEYRKQVRALVSCQDAAWKKALASTPVPFSKPKVKFYQTSGKSPCGRLGTRFPASYCTTSKTLYFSRAAYEQGRYFRLSVAHFVIHEYAHHVQELAGVFDSLWALEEGEAVTTRRVELQAHCMAHYGLTHSALGFGSSDREDAEFQFDYTDDPLGHGSAKAERYWGRRGLAAETIAACNTWKVKAARVK